MFDGVALSLDYTLQTAIFDGVALVLDYTVQPVVFDGVTLHCVNTTCYLTKLQ